VLYQAVESLYQAAESFCRLVEAGCHAEKRPARMIFLLSRIAPAPFRGAALRLRLRPRRAAKIGFNARPHPGLLSREEGAAFARFLIRG